MSIAIPDVVRAAGTTRARDLDVRSILSKGGDPYKLILKTVRSLAADEALHLVVAFKPSPLYFVMRAFGRVAHTEELVEPGASSPTFHVWFFKRGGAGGSRIVAQVAAVERAERVPLQAPFTMDVRGLEPPEPMVRILEKLVELGPGAQLAVHHHRDPKLLYEKLEARGYTAHCHRLADDHFLIQIAPAWTTDEPSN